jgi:hypothetical protein
MENLTAVAGNDRLQNTDVLVERPQYIFLRFDYLCPRDENTLDWLGTPQ